MKKTNKKLTSLPIAALCLLGIVPAYATVLPNVAVYPKITIPSGTVPAQCVSYKLSKAYVNLLNCYLNDPSNTKIADQIEWRFGGQWLKYKQWPATMRHQLAMAFQNTILWYDSGMVNYPGTLVPEPPVNVEASAVANGVHGQTVFDEQNTVLPLYLGQVALTLSAEIYAWVPWSIKNYINANSASPALAVLMNHEFSLRGYVDAAGVEHILGLGPTHTAAHSNAITAFKFLKTNNLIGPTRVDTIGRVLNWARWNLGHMYGAYTSQNFYNYWQYWGVTPVARIIEGTINNDPVAGPYKGIKVHWTQGCYGTTGFLVMVMKAVNIPVATASVGYHQAPYFIGEDLYLSHGDDPYNSLAKSNRPATELLIDKATYQAWFPANDQAAGDLNVGRKVLEQNIKYPSPELVNIYYQDWQAGVSHANGQVYPYFSKWYTVAQLESLGLWTRLDAAIYQMQ